MGNKNVSTHSKQVRSRRDDALEQLETLRDRSDADRHKVVHKHTKGALRYCSGCQAVSAQKRWITDPTLIERMLGEAAGNVEQTLCPGCTRVRDGRIDGWVQLQGAAVREHPERIGAIVDHILADARQDDPVHRLVSRETAGDTATLQTTSQWLAETIGKAIQRELHGDLDIRFSPGEDFVRVYWRQG